MRKRSAFQFVQLLSQVQVLISIYISPLLTILCIHNTLIVVYQRNSRSKSFVHMSGMRRRVRVHARVCLGF